MTIFISWSIEKGREEEDFQVRIWLHFYMLEPSGKRDETAVRHVFQAWFILCKIRISAVCLLPDTLDYVCSSLKNPQAKLQRPK